MDKEPEDFEKRMNEARLQEAQAKAEKAREEARHEKSKREKTEQETEHVRHRKWHDGVNAFAVLGTFCVGLAGVILKAKDKKNGR
ncbi:hypothetical protein AVMA1855_22620 [Acidovorax sp. SUPP1855]|uniref:hypothetical protein n=1 Tax=Acidovorax sp. SUPP1855 TaxID=431774 RepID=UPI0023DE2D8C|nr:hypothetical protein [Acidovorax sp. SUPP1855]GKS86998.1 hypothetical protein AVMA1855_22620 [Acidovorax sp. SUPP1855]